MNELQKFLKGKKTYIVAAIAVATVIANAFGVPIPPIVDQILPWLGLSAIAAKGQRVI